MTIKELKNNLLKSLYSRYKDNKTGAIQLTELCKENNLIYDSLSQLSSAAKSLKDSGYIHATFFVGGGCSNYDFDSCWYRICRRKSFITRRFGN